MIRIINKLAMVGALFVAFFSHAEDVAQYGFNDSIAEQLTSDASYTGSVSGSNHSYLTVNERQVLSVGDDAVVTLPIALSQHVFTDADATIEIEIDFLIADIEQNSIVFSIADDDQNAVWQDGGIKLLVQGGSLIFTYNDGVDLDNYHWQGITSIDENVWYTAALEISTANRSWKVSIADQTVGDSFLPHIDADIMAGILRSNQVSLGGSFGSKISPYLGTFQVDTLTFRDLSLTNVDAVNNAFATLTAHINETNIVSDEQLQSEVDVILQTLYSVDYDAVSENLDNFTQAYEANFGPLYEDGKTYRFEQLPPLAQALQYSQDYLLQTRFVPEHVASLQGVVFEHHSVAPGAVAEGAVRLSSQTVELNASYQTDVAAEIGAQEFVVRPTGYYLAAGDIATLTVPQAIIDKGLSVIVGVHFRNMDYDYIDTINRFPDIATEFPLDSEQIKIANPFGGGIYLKVPDGASADWFTMGLDNVVSMPYFSNRQGRETDVDAWLTQVAESGAPWADFESDKFMFSVPTSWLQNITEPDQIMARWDQILDSFRTASGRPKQRIRAEFYTFDTRLVTPAYGAGYPLVIPIREAVNDQLWNPLTVMEQRPHPTLLHEMGHNHIHPTLDYGVGFDSCGNIEAESVVHTLALASNNLVYNLSLEDSFTYSFINELTLDEAAFDWIISSNFRQNLPMITDQEAPLEDKNMLHYQSRSWAKYADVVRLFGWDTGLGAVNGKFYTPGQVRVDAVCPGREYIVTRDEYIKAASEAIGVNMAPLFHFWGIQPTELLAQELAASYPASPKIAALIKSYRAAVAPQSSDDYQQFHNQMYDKMGYQQPRYDFYLSDFDQQYVDDINAQFDWLLSHYGLLNIDNDNDGMLDEWELLYGLNPNDEQDATEDPDQDKLTNLEEFALQTNPTLADTDEDGLSDSEEVALETDPLNPDSDADGTSDSQDAFPLDASESIDTDNDGIGNNADNDDDNDNVIDADDAFPLDASESIDTDNDGIGNNADNDDDNDNVVDADDAFPLDASESVDTDNDGIGNNADNDDDGDGVADSDDAYPLDATRSSQSSSTNNGNNSSGSDGGGGSFHWLMLVTLSMMLVYRRKYI